MSPLKAKSAAAAEVAGKSEDPGKIQSWFPPDDHTVRIVGIRADKVHPRSIGFCESFSHILRNRCRCIADLVGLGTITEEGFEDCAIVRVPLDPSVNMLIPKDCAKRPV
jgi:hypothetical protein